MNRKGQTTVEFAFTVVILLTLLFAILDFAVMFFVNLTMQHAVREGARYGITGQGKDGQRRMELEKRIQDASFGLYKKSDPPVRLMMYAIEPGDIKDAFSNYTGKPVADTGKSDQIMMVTLTYSWRVLTPVLKPFFTGGKYTFTVRTTMKNENGWPS